MGTCFLLEFRRGALHLNDACECRAGLVLVILVEVEPANGQERSGPNTPSTCQVSLRIKFRRLISDPVILEELLLYLLCLGRPALGLQGFGSSGKGPIPRYSNNFA